MAFELLTVVDVALRGWDYYQERRTPFGKPEFVRAYTGALNKQIDIMRSLDSSSPGELRAGLGLTLQSIAVVVRNFHKAEADGLKINANYMLPLPPTRKLLKSAKFCDRSRAPSAFTCFLSMERWAHPVNGLPTTLVIPVERTDVAARDGTLFGAPKAYLNNETCVVKDTLKLKRHFSTTLPATARAEIGEYFDSHRERLRSFMSIPIERPPGVSPGVGCNQDIVAILNVQSNHKNVAGSSRSLQRNLEITLLPLLTALSHYIIRVHDAPSAPPPPQPRTPQAEPHTGDARLNEEQHVAPDDH